MDKTIILERCKDEYGRFDLRKMLPEVKTIEELREVALTLSQECSDDELKCIWCLSREMSTETVAIYRENVKKFVTSFYEKVMNLPEDVILTENCSKEERKNHFITTYIGHLKHFGYFKKTYYKYDSFINKFINDSEENMQKVQEAIEDEELPEEMDVFLIRLIIGENGSIENDSIQIFPINMFASMKANIYLPWGPYELTEFCCNTYGFREITKEECNEEIKDFIKDHKFGKAV